jgi:hypothetical protein
MIIKLEIDNVIKDVKIKGIVESHQQDYYKKVIAFEKVNDDENISTEDKLKKADEFINWLANLGIKKSDLTEEEISKLDLEEKKKIVEAVKDILQPLSEKKN